MVKRLRINITKIFVFSFIFSLIIFSAGILLGMGLDQYRISDAVSGIKQSDLDIDSYYTERDFLDSFGGDKCSLAGPRVATMSEKLGELGKTLARYDSRRLFRGQEYKDLTREYFLLEIKMYTLLNQLKEDCGSDSTVILFFYDKDDTLSIQQGYILDRLVNRDGDVRIFSVDREFEDSLLETVRLNYGITKSPALVINYDIIRQDYVDFNELLKLVEL